MPEIADTVHYVTRDVGPLECRAALVTRTWPEPEVLSLRVFGLILDQDRAAYRVERADWAGLDTPAGTWHDGHGGAA